MTDTAVASPRSICTICIVGWVVIAIAAIVILVSLRPTPQPPDYSKIPIVTDVNWDTLNAQNWQYTMRTGKNMPSVAVLSDAPLSPVNVLAMPFEGTQPDTEPMVFWHPLPNATEVYAEWWMKFSQTWACNPAGCGKIAFLFPPAGGDMYVGVYCVGTPLGSCDDPAGPKTPMRMGGQLQFGSYGGTPVMPNVKESPIVRDRWYHLAFYFKWSSTKEAHDGIWRWWVDGELNGEYTDIAVSMDPASEFQIAMTKQVLVTTPQYTYFDHTIIRANPPGSVVTSRVPRTPR